MRQCIYFAPTIHDVSVLHKIRSIASVKYLAEQRGFAAQASAVSEGPAVTGRSVAQPAREPAQQLHGHYCFDSASSYYSFPARPPAPTSASASVGLVLAPEFMPPAPITTGAAPVLSGPQLSRPQLPLPPVQRRYAPESELGAPPESTKAEMPPVCTFTFPPYVCTLRRFRECLLLQTHFHLAVLATVSLRCSGKILSECGCRCARRRRGLPGRP